MEGTSEDKGEVQGPASTTTDWLDWPSLRKPEGKVIKGDKGKFHVSENQSRMDGFLLKKTDKNKPPMFTSTSKGLVIGAPHQQKFPGPAGSSAISALQASSKRVSFRQLAAKPKVTGEIVQIESIKMQQQRMRKTSTDSLAVSSDCLVSLVNYLTAEAEDNKRFDNKVSIKWIKDNDAVFATGLQLVPYLVAVVTEELSRSPTLSANVIKVEDETGGMQLVLHPDIIKKYSGIIRVGSVIFVQKVRQQITHRSRYLTVMMQNVVFIATSAEVDSINFIVRPLSVNPFPLYRRLTDSVVVVQISHWKLDELRTNVDNLIEETSKASAPVQKKRAPVLQERSSNPPGLNRSKCSVAEAPGSVNVGSIIDSGTPENSDVDAGPSNKKSRTELEKDENAQEDEWGDESDFMLLLKKMDKY